MQSYFFVLILLVITCELSVVEAQNDALDQIESHLANFDQDGSRGGDPEVMLERALELKNPLKSLFGSSSRSEDVDEFLTKLSKLRRVAAKGKCKKSSNDLRESLMNTVNQTNAANSYRRLTELVGHYAKRLAKVCQLEYLQRFLPLDNELYARQEEFELMHLFLMEVVVGISTKHQFNYRAAYKENRETILNYLRVISTPAMRARLVGRVISVEQSVGTKFIAEVAYSTIEKYVKDQYLVEPDQDWSMRALAARNAFMALIFSSCEKYLQILGPHLFELAQADVKYLDQEDLLELAAHSLSNFYMAWAEYTFCWYLVYDDENRTRLLDLIGQEAERRSKGPSDDDENCELHAAGSCSQNQR